SSGTAQALHYKRGKSQDEQHLGEAPTDRRRSIPTPDRGKSLPLRPVNACDVYYVREVRPRPHPRPRAEPGDSPGGLNGPNAPGVAPPRPPDPASDLRGSDRPARSC